MMTLMIVGALAALVVLGSAAIVVGGRYLHLPANVVALTFALTALSWLALLVAAIGLMVRTIATAKL
ncbi:MAG: hypothetical protein HXY39_12000 [Chloroflexi bacterium]|nr:hypothetical protein [Chloroflexota bacterium]